MGILKAMVEAISMATITAMTTTSGLRAKARNQSIPAAIEG